MVDLVDVLARGALRLDLLAHLFLLIQGSGGSSVLAHDPMLLLYLLRLIRCLLRVVFWLINLVSIRCYLLFFTILISCISIGSFFLFILLFLGSCLLCFEDLIESSLSLIHI